MMPGGEIISRFKRLYPKELQKSSNYFTQNQSIFLLNFVTCGDKIGLSIGFFISLCTS